jgi:hypothetical protein
MPSTLKPKAPVTWSLSIELNDQEREAWEKFFYNLRDGVVDTKLDPANKAVFVNRADELYNLLHSEESY